MVTSTRLEVRGDRCVGRVKQSVELAVASRATLAELRMECKALETTLTALRLDADLPVGRGQIDKHRDGFAIAADLVEPAIHVAGEVALRSRLVQHGHDAGRGTIEVGDGGKLGK